MRILQDVNVALDFGGLSTGTSLGKSIVLSQIDGTILARTISRNVNALGRQQPEASVASDLQGVNVEICVEIVRRLHDRRRRRHDDETAAFADPVDMPMPVHEDTSLRHRLQAAQDQLPLTRVVPTRSDRTFAARGYSTGWWWSPMSQQARGCCAKTMSIALACAAEITPSDW